MRRLRCFFRSKDFAFRRSLRMTVEGEVVAGGRHADAEFGAIAARDDGEFFERGEADDCGDFFGGGGLCDGGRKNCVDCVIRAYGWAGGDVGGADERLEARGEIGRCLSHWTGWGGRQLTVES